MRIPSLVLLSVLNLVVLAAVVLAPTLTVPLEVGDIRPESGHNFIASVAIRPPFPYVFIWDGMGGGDESTATVLEDGHELGPPHSPHADIRSDGGGRFSFWVNSIYFSTSDNSDPRTNGRAYAARAETRLPRRVIFGLLGIDILAAIALRRALVDLLSKYGPAVATGGLVCFAAYVMLAPSAGFAPLFAMSASVIDGRMALSIAGHVAIGFCLTALIFTTGAGLLVLVGRRTNRILDLVLEAFLPGTLVVAAAAALALIAPFGAAAAALVCAMAAAPLARYRPDRHTLWRVLVPALRCAPAVSLYAVVLSFRFHGPSTALAGAPLGDETIYVGWANTLLQHVFPFFSYAAEGFRTPYGNLLPSLIMSPLLRGDWFDPYLFISASLPVVALLSLGLMIPALACSVTEADEAPRRSLDAVLFALLLAGSFRNPSSLIESPPFVFLLPVVVSTLHFALPRVAGPARPALSLTTAIVGTAMSKVVAFVVLVPLSLPTVARHLLSKASRGQKIGAAVCGIVAIVYVAVAVVTYLPLFLAVGTFGPPSWETIVRYHTRDPFVVFCCVARDVGTIVLAASVLKSKWRELRFGVWLGVGLALLMPFLFHTSLTTAMLLIAVTAWVHPRMISGLRWPLLAGAALMLPYAMLKEYGGVSVAMIWLFVAGILTLVIVEADRERASVANGPGVRARGLAVPTLIAAVTLVSLVGAGNGAIAVGPQGFSFTPDMRDIWLAVRSRTPRDALIFTDQTGDRESRTGGWNDFALSAQRQFYIVSWSTTPLRTDAEARAERLERNAAVLSGELAIGKLGLSRHYGGYYAVLSKSRSAPAGSTLLYQNPSYALYRLAS